MEAGVRGGKTATGCVSRALDSGPPRMLATGERVRFALNVAAGGSMVEVDGHAADPGDGDKPAYHRIYIAPGGKLAATVGSGGFVRVNSRHRHGVREAQKAPGLLATAYSLEDGVIEALESPEHAWVIGVQFHPRAKGRTAAALRQAVRQPRRPCAGSIAHRSAGAMPACSLTARSASRPSLRPTRGMVRVDAQTTPMRVCSTTVAG